MNLWSADKIMNRLNAMLDHAIAGEPIEDTFDETKMSALETKMEKYLAMNQLSKKELRIEKERVSELISDISHQTKTPIANLLLYSELLEEKIQDEQTRELVDAIHIQAEKLSFLIQSLMKTARLESGVIQTVPEENCVKELLQHVEAQAEYKAEKKGIQIECSCVEAKALFDMKWTVEAVYNIVDNAIKYTSPGGKIQINIREYPLFIRLDIEDNGIGISEEEIPKIFGRFYKSNHSQQKEGVGLGLYLAREIISGQGGYIKVTSKLGTGTVFSVFLRNVM